MATVAELRMDVDSRPVKNAEKDLDRLSKSAERTERATNKMGAGARRAGGGVQDYARRVRDGARENSAFELAIGRAIGRLAGFAAGVIGVTAALRGLSAGLKAADDFRALDNRIKLVTNSAEEFAQVQSGLIDISRRTFASIDGTVQAYQRMAGATDRLGISQARLLGVAETVNKAVALSGATSQAAEASLIQFGQALSNNFEASAQEINSLNEQVFALSDAIARGITKITGTEVFRSDLKRLAEDGKLSSELVIAALEAVKDETDKTFGDLDRTFAQIAQRLKTNAQIISKEAFGPLLQVKIDFYERFAAALEDPRTIQAAQKFGAQLVDIARTVEKNADRIGKAFQGIAAAGGFLATIAVVNTLRSAVIALGVAVTANPVGLLVTGIAAAIAVIVTFRDEITRALTPFKNFKELADEVGPVIRGSFKIAQDAAESLKLSLQGLAAILKGVIDDLPKVRNTGNINDGLISKYSQAKKTSQNVIFGSLLNALGAVGRSEQEIDSRRTTFEAVLARYKTGAKEATDETIKIGEAANDASKFWGTLGGEADNVAGKLRQGIAEAERLFEASKRGSIAFEREERIISIEKAAAEAVAKAKDAGETLSLATAVSLETKRRDMLAAADAMLDAEKALRERAKAKAGEIERSVGRTVDQILAGGEISLAGLNPGELLKAGAAFRSAMEDALSFLESDATIGINADTLLELRASIIEAGEDHASSIKEAMTDGAKAFQNAAQEVFSTVLDDLFFNGGRGIGSILKSVTQDITRSLLLDPLSRAFSGKGSIFENLEGAARSLSNSANNLGSALFGGGKAGLAAGSIFSAFGAGVAGLGFGKGIADLIGLKKGSVGRGLLVGGVGGALGGALAGTAAFAAAGAPVGAALGLGAAAGGPIGLAVGAIVAGLLAAFGGKPSDNASGGGINFTSFRAENQFAKNNDPETIAARDQILEATSTLAQTLVEKTGATLAGSGISIQVGKRDGTRIISAAGGDVTTPVGDAQAALDEIFRQLVASLKGGEKALVDYVKAAQAAGRAPDAVIDGLQRLKSVFDLTKEPLSEIASALKTIDDAVNPVIDDLKSLGQSIAGIQQIAQDAAKAVGAAFLKDIRALNIDLQNSVFGQFSRLLEEIRQREEDARLLFQRGAISSQQLGFVQSTGGLQVSKFFEGLSDDDKESLADFLGLLKTASGDIAVARVKLEEQFNYLIDNVEETAHGFEEAAQNYARLNENLKQTADAIRTEFSGLTPRDNAITLQGRVAELLAQARDATASTESRQSALTALSPTVTQLVEKARQAFGGTEQFARLRDFGLSALDEAATLSDTLAKFNQSQADAAREDVKLLTDIRELLNDDRQLPTLQGILDEGKLTNQLIAQQLQAFLNLMSSAGSNLNQITADQLQQAAAAYLAQQQSQIAQQTPPPASSSSGTTAPTSSVTEAQFAQALVDQAAATDRNTTAIANMGADIYSLTLEIRRYVTRSAA